METQRAIDHNTAPKVRVALDAPGDLVANFRAIAKQRDQTLSQEVRRLMREYIEAACDEQAAA